MKSINKFFVLLTLCVSVGCSKPDEINYGASDDGPQQVSIAYLRSFYQRAPVLIEGEIYIVGRVVSTDEFGAFYKTIVIEDDSGGITLQTDMENYHRIYRPGDTFKMACNSLTINSYGGQLRLGMAGGDIPEEELPTMLIRDNCDEECAPLPLAINDIKPAHIQRWVCFDGVQFEERGPWYGSEERHIVDREGHRLEVRTSPYSAFAAVPLPAGSGYIEGVLNVFNGTYQLEVWADRYAIMGNERF
jgi:hypothetical protein